MRGDGADVAVGRPKPGWTSVALIGCACIVIASIASCGWATDRSRLSRAVLWRDADMRDIDRFPKREIGSGEDVFTFQPAHADGYPLLFGPVAVTRDEVVDSIPLATLLEDHDTWSFLVIRRDTLLFERYFDGRESSSVETTFSVSKSLVSIGVGLAVDRGLMSVDDPVTQYVPELAERDERFERLTVRHLLTMTSGIRFERSKMPWGDEATSYYDPNLRNVALRLNMAREPGTEFQYNFYNPILLGLALERATGQPLTSLLEDGVWRRIGTEGPASWSLDSKVHGFEKMESGFNARPRDLARLGRLFLRKGDWDGTRILSEQWVNASVAVDSTRGGSLNYQYFWWLHRPETAPHGYYAEGRFGQFIYVVPALDLVIVRTGSDDGDLNWPSLFALISSRVTAVDSVAREPSGAPLPN